MSSRSRSSSLSATSTATAATSAADSSTTTIILQDEHPAIKFDAEHDDARLDAAYDSKDLQDPTPENKSSPPPLPFLPKPNTDPNLVKWDGPDDPQNPQNWSFWYKWWITAVCTITTLNVYVLPPELIQVALTLSSAVHSLLRRHPLRYLLSRITFM
jgi:DHA1 family multidrug resistance protein-like MFS transporter